VVESWSGLCPLDGRCSECGLGFDWRDVLSPKRRLPRWSFEHAPRSRCVPSFFATLRRAAIPPHLWGSIRMEMEIVPARLRAFTLLSIALFKLTGLTLLGTALVITWYLNPAGWNAPTRLEQAYLVLWPYREYGPARFEGYILSPWLLIALLTGLLVPFAFFTLPVSLRRARVRRAHIARIQAYALAMLAAAIGFWSLAHTVLIIVRIYDHMLLWELDLAYVDEAAPKVGAATVVLVTTWLLWNWHVAVRRYLRLQHSFAVAIAMVSIASLVAFIIVVMIYGHSLF
jgi:hypothetical protein